MLVARDIKQKLRRIFFWTPCMCVTSICVYVCVYLSVYMCVYPILPTLLSTLIKALTDPDHPSV